MVTGYSGELPKALHAPDVVWRPEEETWHAVHEGDTVGGLENASNLMIANLEKSCPPSVRGGPRVHGDTRPSATPIQENSYHDRIINCPVPIQLGAGAPHSSLKMLCSNANSSGSEPKPGPI